jgi:hypothetical protein
VFASEDEKRSPVKKAARHTLLHFENSHGTPETNRSGIRKTTSDKKKKKKKRKRKNKARCQWLTPVMLATQEVEIRRIAVCSQSRQIVLETLS